MINKHFLKTLVLFTMIIIIGLIGIFLVSRFDKEEKQLITVDLSNL